MAYPTESADDEKASTENDSEQDTDRLDPRVREHVEEHGSPAHGYDYAPDRTPPARKADRDEDTRQTERGDREQ